MKEKNDCMSSDNYNNSCKNKKYKSPSNNSNDNHLDIDINNGNYVDINIIIPYTELYIDGIKTST